MEKLLKQKNEFIHMLSHDLKNPLVALHLMFPILEENIHNKDLNEFIKRGHKNVKKMQEMITEIIGLALLDDIEERIEFCELNICDNLQDVLNNLTIILNENGVIVENMINKNCVVKADSLRLGEVFNNLIINCVKYKSDEKTCHIKINAVDNDDMITVSIQDNGIGMTEDEINHAFEKYYSTGNFKNCMQSSGLGLTICHAIVEKHGGNMWIESPGKGHGSTFYFTLPKA
jgi:signal transduction histidine kinase